MSTSPSAGRRRELPAYLRTSTPPSQMLTTREACAYLCVGKTTLRTWIADVLRRKAA